MLPVYKNILYATDLSPASRQALKHAAALADRFDADVTVLHILPDSLEQFSQEAGMDLATHLGEEAAHFISRGEMDQALKAVHKRLNTILTEDFTHPETGAHLINAGIKVVCGEPFEQILGEAKKGGHDLIVMGTHGLGGLLGMMLGSVAKKIVAHSTVPVLVVPLPENQ